MSMPHLEKGHRLVMTLSSSGGSLGIMVKHWPLSHFLVNSWASLTMVG